MGPQSTSSSAVRRPGLKTYEQPDAHQKTVPALNAPQPQLTPTSCPAPVNSMSINQTPLTRQPPDINEVSATCQP
eukprot:scaffold126867_cov21-Tisochrysis_lutea.AAC.1